MKNKEELKNLKEEVENESKKPHELTEEDLEQVTGGLAHFGLGVAHDIDGMKDVQ